MDTAKDLPTIWEIPDDLWERIQPILRADYDQHRRSRRGQPPVCWRRCLNGIIYRMRSGCQWNRLPQCFGDDSTIHRWFQRWCLHGVMEKIWAVMVQECDELGAVDWRWQSADGSMRKARFGGDKVGKNPTDRGKKGVKRSVIVEGDGGPLGVVLDGANRHDTKLLGATIEAIVVERPEPTAEEPQHLCLDKAYDNPTGHQAAADGKYTAHIRRIGQEKAAAQAKHPDAKPRRWVVERTHAWLCKCRAILVR